MGQVDTDWNCKKKRLRNKRVDALRDKWTLGFELSKKCKNKRDNALRSKWTQIGIAKKSAK